MKTPKLSQKWFRRGAKLLGNKGKVLVLAKEAIEFVGSHGKLEKISEETVIVGHLLYDWARGKYRGIGKTNLLWIVAGLLYLVNPMDMVPDFLLGIGFLDDLTVMTGIFAKVAVELDKYKTWRREQGLDESPDGEIIDEEDISPEEIGK